MMGSFAFSSFLEHAWSLFVECSKCGVCPPVDSQAAATLYIAVSQNEIYSKMEFLRSTTVFVPALCP